MGNMSHFTNLRSATGSVILLLQYYAARIGIKRVVYLNDLWLYGHGIYPPFELLSKISPEFDVVINYPDYLDKNTKREYILLGKEFAKKHRLVMVRDVAIEAGGGSDILREVKFIYDTFQPYIDLVGNVMTIKGLIDIFYKHHDKVARTTQFTVCRQIDDVKYSYVFDKLTADQAIEASNLVPSEDTVRVQRKTARDIYLRYLVNKKSWIEFDPSDC